MPYPFTLQGYDGKTEMAVLGAQGGGTVTLTGRTLRQSGYKVSDLMCDEQEFADGLGLDGVLTEDGSRMASVTRIEGKEPPVLEKMTMEVRWFDWVRGQGFAVRGDDQIFIHHNVLRDAGINCLPQGATLVGLVRRNGSHGVIAIQSVTVHRNLMRDAMVVEYADGRGVVRLASDPDGVGDIFLNGRIVWACLRRQELSAGAQCRIQMRRAQKGWETSHIELMVPDEKSP